jgi:outer membrane lipoprotein-sorting protein
MALFHVFIIVQLALLVKLLSSSTGDICGTDTEEQMKEFAKKIDSYKAEAEKMVREGKGKRTHI